MNLMCYKSACCNYIASLNWVSYKVKTCSRYLIINNHMRIVDGCNMCFIFLTLVIVIQHIRHCLCLLDTELIACFISKHKNDVDICVGVHFMMWMVFCQIQCLRLIWWVQKVLQCIYNYHLHMHSLMC